MDYLLLTGCTGLVGRYLLRDLFEVHERVAVLVRPDAQGGGRQRVESIMNHWEREAGRALPRPVVLEGDLNHPGAGLDADQFRWVADRCGAVLHCAASMRFREDKRGEPLRTNVEGTRCLLDLCREAGIRDLHYVSTAYICGLREGRVLETEVDVGQQLGNVYEQSKLRAEKMVRDSDFLRTITIYRPASVVGDSRTGYVSSTHGFYLPLQLAFVMADKVPVDTMDERFFSRLGLRGDEGKNLVPVEWLSQAIAYLVNHREHHGKTYHLASSAPVLVKTIQRVVRDAIRKYSPKPLARSVSDADMQKYESWYREYMSVYESHWRDDPTFDLTNTSRALPHLSCPDLDYDCLMRVARYPVQHHFNLHHNESVETEFDVGNYLSRFATVELQGSSEAADKQFVGLQVNGSGGGQWHVLLQDRRVADIRPGLPPTDPVRAYLSAATFRSLTDGRATLEHSINSGRVVVEGAQPGIESVMHVLRQIVTAA